MNRSDIAPIIAVALAVIAWLAKDWSAAAAVFAAALLLLERVAARWPRRWTVPGVVSFSLPGDAGPVEAPRAAAALLKRRLTEQERAHLTRCEPWRIKYD